MLKSLLIETQNIYLAYTDSKVKCEPLVPIPNGHILFKSVDMTTTQPGDLVTYSCEIPYVLEGDSYRICLGNGSWSGEEPTCSLPGICTCIANNTRANFLNWQNNRSDPRTSSWNTGTSDNFWKITNIRRINAGKR